MTNQTAYDLYVSYCESVGCTPADYKKWSQIERNPVEYERASVPVDPLMVDPVGSRSPWFGLWSSE